MKRIGLLTILCGLMVWAAACGGNSTLNDTEAVVLITADIREYNPEVNMAVSADVTIARLELSSTPKNPEGGAGAAQDANLSRWVVTPYRTDGGQTASPEWINDVSVYVPYEGTATLENYRVFPQEYFNELPLSHLFPENGGFDPETGQTNIRQTLQIEIFGTTNGGKSVSCQPFRVAFNFFFGI